MDLKPFLAWLKEETLPGIWSKGVALARSAKAELVSTKEGSAPELKFKLQTGERLLAFQVTLWPSDEDAFCNCEGKVQPCHHVIATAQIYDQGRAVLPEANPEAASTSVRYEWEMDKRASPPRLLLKRFLGGKIFEGSLISLVSGIESGRIAQALPSTTSTDLQIDEILMKAREIGARTDWARLLKCIAQLEPIPLAGTALKLSASLTALKPKLFLTLGGDGLSLRAEFPEYTKLSEGIAQINDQILLQPSATTLDLPTFIKKSDFEDFFTITLPKLQEHFEIAESDQLPEVVDASLALTLKMDRLGRTDDSTTDQLVVTPLLHYTTPTGTSVRILEGKLFWENGGALTEIPRRDRAAETALIQKLRRELNLGLNQPASYRGEEARQFSKKLSETSWATTAAKSAPILESYNNDQLYKPRLELKDGRMNLFFVNRKGENVQIAENQLQQLNENPDRPVMDSLKEYGRVPENFWNEFGAEILRLTAKKEPLQKTDLLLARGLIQEHEGLVVEPTSKNLSALDPSLMQKLRPYQAQGVQWIFEHLKESRGALLADEMGLGKTVQTISALQTPALIAVPTSLLSNWKQELKRFRPELSVNLYHGPGRKLVAADITLTTYGILRQEIETLSTHDRAPWAMMVLDEAHQLRNQETLSTQAVTQVQTAFKLALSGTPIQNHLKDLYTLFAIIQPGLFESRDHFFTVLEKPRLFSAKTSPFILRRLKEDVLKELPAKTQMLHPVTLSEDEEQLYEATLLSAKKEVAQRLEEAGQNPLTLFEMLLRARQVCDHPGLFIPEKTSLSSAKLTALTDLLSELTENGHSVLVYSQWTKFLDRIEAELGSNELLRTIPFERLDGSTQNRASVIESFQSAKDATIFLLSLHAGGVGLNLTKADHVIFCEPWWNPYVELQAEDRVHRMGQEKPVFIHRLIVEGSIEEGMLKLQEQKKSLQAALTVDDIQTLLL